MGRLGEKIPRTHGAQDHDDGKGLGKAATRAATAATLRLGLAAALGRRWRRDAIGRHHARCSATSGVPRRFGGHPGRGVPAGARPAGASCSWRRRAGTAAAGRFNHLGANFRGRRAGKVGGDIGNDRRSRPGFASRQHHPPRIDGLRPVLRQEFQRPVDGVEKGG